MNKLTDIQNSIRKTLEEHVGLMKIQSHIQEIDQQLENNYHRIKDLDKLLDKELKDIESLEKLGVKALFHKTLGTKEKQIEKERQEYLELSLQHKEMKKEVELMEFERDLLSKKLNTLPDLKYKLEELKLLRQKEILNDLNSETREEFTQLLHQLDLSHSLKKEVEEALIEGEKSYKSLNQLISLIDKAEEWGRWDMYRDNRRAAYLKKRSIDQAIQFLPRVQHQLNLFNRELKDLGEKSVSLNLDRIHIEKFRDFFFDNLISDWIILQRIKNTLSALAGTSSHIKRILLSLENEQKVLIGKIEELNEQRDKMLVS